MRSAHENPVDVGAVTVSGMYWQKGYGNVLVGVVAGGTQEFCVIGKISLGDMPGSIQSLFSVSALSVIDYLDEKVEATGLPSAAENLGTTWVLGTIEGEECFLCSTCYLYSLYREFAVVP